MLVDYREHISPERRKHLDAIKDALKSIEGEVRVMFEDHKTNSRRWYPHEILPWGAGQDYNEVPWSEAQVKVSPDIVMAFETNLLTEDNLPYYHAEIAQMMDKNSIWQEWNRRWTAEEGMHGAAMRDYLYLTRAVEPYEMEQNRLAVMEQGFDRNFDNPLEIFSYTAAQELATRISHLRCGQKADEPIALKLLTLIARDENFHYVFYRGVCAHILKIAPELMLPAMVNQLYSFEMPGSAMSNFEIRQAVIADAGIYGAREHRDQVIRPLMKFWKIDELTGLSPEAQKQQERLLKLDKLLTRLVERQERRQRKTDNGS